MKASELRIGNYVFCPEIGDTFTDRYPYLGECIFSINQINTWGIRVNIGHDAVQKLNFDESIEPIRITEEWLPKFGFEKEDFYWFKQYEWNNWGMRLNTFDNSWIAFHGFANQFSELMSIQYIHTLQNLYFALTGEELTLKK